VQGCDIHRRKRFQVSSSSTTSTLKLPVTMDTPLNRRYSTMDQLFHPDRRAITVDIRDCIIQAPVPASIGVSSTTNGSVGAPKRVGLVTQWLTTSVVEHRLTQAKVAAAAADAKTPPTVAVDAPITTKSNPEPEPVVATVFEPLISVSVPDPKSKTDTNLNVGSLTASPSPTLKAMTSSNAITQRIDMSCSPVELNVVYNYNSIVNSSDCAVDVSSLNAFIHENGKKITITYCNASAVVGARNVTEEEHEHEIDIDTLVPVIPSTMKAKLSKKKFVLKLTAQLQC
jgi:hypothetical protein